MQIIESLQFDKTFPLTSDEIDALRKICKSPYKHVRVKSGISNAYIPKHFGDPVPPKGFVPRTAHLHENFYEGIEAKITDSLVFRNLLYLETVWSEGVKWYKVNYEEMEKFPQLNELRTEIAIGLLTGGKDTDGSRTY